MRRCAIAIATLFVALVSFSTDLAACGDKYARLGHSGRLGNYYAINRASILIYQAPKPDRKAEQELQAALKRAGNESVIVPRGTLLSHLATGQYDLVIALYPDAAAIKDQLRAVASAPDVVPILFKPKKEIAAKAAQEYHSIIRTDEMLMVDVLEEIDHAMTTRLKSLSAPGGFGLQK